MGDTTINPQMVHPKRIDLNHLLFVCFLGLQLKSVSVKSHSFKSVRQSSHGINSCFTMPPINSASTVLREKLSQSVTTAPMESVNSSPDFDNLLASTSTPPPELYSVNVRYDSRSQLTYDPTTGRYLDVVTEISPNNEEDNPKINIISRFLQSAFVPEGVTPSYYRFMRWRILQRFINANVHVIGTQSLLMGLRGMHGRGSGGVGAVATGAAAATNWVLKDTLGKIVRMVWASKMGRKFDPDAKRWRFRSSLIYALGNGLEVSTYLHPQYFLVLAMLANSCKQMSMLTSSATRNALYNSFKRISTANGGGRNNDAVSGNKNMTVGRRGSGATENIGDITAKGEAQIAVVDLMGIASGICLSRAVGVSVKNVFAVWIILQVMEIFCMHKEMRAIVYKTFNFERMYTLLGEMLEDDDDLGVTPVKLKTIPTPEQIAAKEKIFLSPDHLARRAIAFGSPGRTMLDPDELTMLVNDIFIGEKYFLVVGQDLKNARGLSAKVRQLRRRQTGGSGVSEIDPQEQCHIVLHADANNLDILKSALALVLLRRKLVKLDTEMKADANHATLAPLRSRDCTKILREARTEADAIFPRLLRELTKQGWHPPLRSMLGSVSARAEWPIQKQKGGSRAHSPSILNETVTILDMGNEEG